jgi:fatty acyl-CoA reductase
MVTHCKRVADGQRSCEFFAINQWNVDNENVYRLLKTLSIKDAVTFNFDMRNIDWNKYIFEYCLGIRKHIMKEDDSTAPAARRRIAR